MPTQLEAPAILRGMLRDVVACSDYHTVCEMLGMVPAGPDVDEIEHYKSHMRIEAFNQVADEVFPHADIAADMLYRLVRLNRDDEDDEDDSEHAMFTVVSRTAVAIVIGHLLENGTLGVKR
ncbi:hypothetical protein ACLGIH_19980 [Streptomyces sp. HMX87]|uniref:hypothetical protein n=1 Tax=Streptomyces sp. HMX87 TaxID=3390849 RepID=UPI003A89E583